MSLRDEIVDILKDVYYNNDGADPFDEKDADRILKLIEKRIDSIKEYNTPANSTNLNKHEQVKIMHYLLALDDVKELLK